MKLTKSIQQTVEVVYKRICDRCDNSIPWNTGAYDLNEFKLSYIVGSDYPEGQFGTKWEVEDLCDDCIDHLKDVLLAEGFKVKESEL